MRLLRLALVLLCVASGFAQTATKGLPLMHDPSTIIRDGDLYYVFASSDGVPIFSSPDLVHWKSRGSVFTRLPAKVVKLAPGNDGMYAWAPDIIKVGDTFYLYYAVSSLGSTAAAIALATNTTLNPDDSAYHWVDRGTVVSSDGKEDMYAIDPGVIQTPDGKLWLSYGSYHGAIGLVQLNPKTGLQTKPDSLPHLLALESEASDIIAHDGWFYLFVNHGTCCKGVDSTYHINVGRSRKITGPYVDRKGKSLMDVPGEPFLASEGEHIGPGHFGRVIDAEDKTERFSIHYEADTGTQGKPVLAVRMLQWSDDGWPEAGPPTEAHAPETQSLGPVEPPDPRD